MYFGAIQNVLGVFDFHLDLPTNELLNMIPYFSHFQSPESTFFMISQITWDVGDRVTVFLWLLSRFLFICRLPLLLVASRKKMDASLSNEYIFEVNIASDTRYSYNSVLIITCTLSWVRLLTLLLYCYYQSLLIT